MMTVGIWGGGGGAGGRSSVRERRPARAKPRSAAGAGGRADMCWPQGPPLSTSPPLTAMPMMAIRSVTWRPCRENSGPRGGDKGRRVSGAAASRLAGSRALGRPGEASRRGGGSRKHTQRAETRGGENTHTKSTRSSPKCHRWTQRSALPAGARQSQWHTQPTRAAGGGWGRGQGARGRCMRGCEGDGG